MKMGFSIACQTARENLRATLTLSLVFMVMAVMYAAVYPSFKDSMGDLLENSPEMPIRGFESSATYPGFLNVELYQIFWVLILALVLGYFAGSLVSKEVESRTMDMLLSNPVPRYRIVLEKFLGLVPAVLTVNFATMVAVIVVTPAIGEELVLGDLLLTHVSSIPYFLAVLAIGVLVSTIIDEKMKASMVVMGIIIGSYVLETVSLLVPDYENLGLVSLTHYFNPADPLLKGSMDVVGGLILVAITAGCLLVAVWHFERRDIRV
jgi:ABC-2 type transport system permease protein